MKGHERFHRRWQREHPGRVIHEDLRDLEHVRDVTMLDLLFGNADSGTRVLPFATFCRELTLP